NKVDCHTNTCSTPDNQGGNCDCVHVENQGNLFMLDNEITSSTAQGAKPIYAASTSGAPQYHQTDVVSILNKFSYLTSDVFDGDPSHRRATEVQPALGQSLSVAVPGIPTLLADPVNSRPVYTVTDGNNVQEVVNEAAAAGTAIVH